MKFQVLTAFLFGALFANGVADAQNQSGDTANTPYWVKMMGDPDANFYQTQRAFNLYWKDREITPGCGYKPFKRWEEMVRSFVREDGTIEPFAVQTNNYEKWAKQKITSVKRGSPCTNGFWKELGPNNLTGGGVGRINAIAFHPTDSNIMYCGAPAGGIWKTTDKGKRWFPLGDSLLTLGVSSIVIDPTNPNIIYIGTGDRDAGHSAGKGVYKSTDGGKTFVAMTAGMTDRTVSKLIMNPNNSSQLLAATTRGIYRTTNAGLSWTQVSLGLKYMDMDYKPFDYSIIYASANGDFYRSQDSGKSFIKIVTNINGWIDRGAIGVSPKNPNLVYFIVTGTSDFYGIYLSRDAGLTFRLKANSPNLMARDAAGAGTGGQAFYDLDIAVNPLNEAEVFVGGINMCRSLDSGATWKIDAYSIHVDQHALEFSPITRNLCVGNDGGVYERKKHNGQWTAMLVGLGIGQVYRIAVSNREDYLLNGYQDNGTKSYNGKGVYYYEGGGDGMDNAFNKSDPQRYFVSSQNGSIWRVGNGQTGEVSADIFESGAWVTPFILREGVPTTLIAGYKNIWMCENIYTPLVADLVWTAKANGIYNSGATIHKIENSPYDNTELYFSREDNKFFRTSNLSATNPSWTDLTSKLPATGQVEAIECDHLSYDVYIGLLKKVYVSTNGGYNWTDISAGLPDVNVYCLVMDTSKTDGSIYAGTYAGVYYKNKNMSAWVPFNNQLPKAVWVTDMEISYAGKRSSYKLIAGTFGRGTWESSLYDYGSTKPVAYFVPKYLAVCKGSTLQLYDESAYAGELKWTILNKTGAVFADFTDSSSINPKIKFTQAGYYYIRLINSNCTGSDTFTQRIAVYEDLKPMCNITATNPTFKASAGIQRVRFRSIDNVTMGPYYNGANEDFTCLDLQELSMDSTYSLNVDTYSEYCKAYIDFNNDGVFSEQQELVLNSPKRTSHIRSFSIPKTAVTNTKLRFRIISYKDSITGPCMGSINAQSEDYAVVIKKLYDFSTPYATVCLNTNVVFNDTFIEAYQTYKWNFGANATPATANGRGPHLVKYSKLGKKTITATMNDTLVVTKTDLIEVVTPAISSFYYVDAGANTFNFIPYNFTYETYFWTFGDGNTSSLQKPTYTYKNNGDYTVKLFTGIPHCLDSSAKALKAKSSSIMATGETGGIKIVPNPSSGDFMVQLGTGMTGEITLQLTDDLGRLVFESTQQSPTGDKIEMKLSQRNLPSGIYLLNVSCSKGNFGFRLVIE